MTTIEAIIERAKDGTYSVYCKDEIFSGAGETLAEAKEDMARQMSFYRETENYPTSLIILDHLYKESHNTVFLSTFEAPCIIYRERKSTPEQCWY